MNVTSRIVRFAAACLLLALGACGGGGDDAGAGTPPPGSPPPAAQPSGTVVVAATGGTVSGPNGASVVIPPGALATDTTIAIEPSGAGATPLPGGFTAFGSMFAFTPHGTTFAVPVTMTLPFDPSSVPTGATPQFYKTNAQNQWEQVANATFGADTATAQVTGFSDATVVIPPLERHNPERIWEFQTYPGDGGAATTLPCDSDNCRSTEGIVDKIVEFGPADFDTSFIRSAESLPEDGKANGFVFSTANGVTYGVLAEAPSNRLGFPEPIGSVARLTQLQSYVKRAADASLTFTVTHVDVEAGDFNPGGEFDDILISGELLLDVGAYKTPNAYFFRLAGRASVNGHNGSWFPSVQVQAFVSGSGELWKLDDFDFTTRTTSYDVGGGDVSGSCPGTQAQLKFKKPRTYTVDLSSIGLNEEFTLRAITFADTNNRRGGGAKGDCQASFVAAYLQDPLEIGGTTLTIKGLEPTNRPLPAPPDQVLVEPASCVPGPGPNAAAGVLQFDAASYRISEAPGAVPTVTVTRAGGSLGAVTATFTTGDGTAIGGTDYTPVNATVFFADGDTAPRVVEVPILADQTGEPDKTVNLSLSQPGGCAALGPQTTAVLVIRDDDPVPPSSTSLDAGFGIEGKASASRFGGDRSAMALAPDGKIVMVGGTFADFILARFNADGSLDASFGAGGKVTTDMVAGVQEEALGVAIQGDGKIVVVGYAGVPRTPPAPAQPPNFALARYNLDGSLDASFGVGGKVTSGVVGQAFAVAIQPDGKIVVVGDFTVPTPLGSNFSDFALARYNADGSLDAGFGSGGSLTTDLADGANHAANIVLQANGAIVVSGKPVGSQPGFDRTDVARYNANGSLDASFGAGGKLTLAGKEVGEGLALQRDGKFVLVGSVDASVAPAPPGSVTEFALVRLDADGSPDTAFGNAGAVSTAISPGERDGAQAVALQADGRIVVAGSSSNVNRDFAVARYNTDGTLDTSFGSGFGFLTIDFFRFTDIAESVAVQPDGKIVLGGLAQDIFDGYGVARVLP